MRLTSITILIKPPAFIERDDIEYVQLDFEVLDFTSWARGRISYAMQIPTGLRDLAEILRHLFTEIIPISQDEKTIWHVSVADSLLGKEGWFLEGGFRQAGDNFQIWEL